MLKTSKKILSVLMIVLLVTTAVPLSGFVGLELPALDWGIKASAVASSGQCGENVYWTYDSVTKELEISGKGAMANYNPDASPFYNSDIKSIVIEDGVTVIGDFSFANCNTLISVVIADSVTSIGDQAFWCCYNMSSITFGNGLKSIGDYAFYNCDYVTSVTIPDGVTSIGNGAFNYCNRLADITLSDSLTFIGSDAFYYTSYYNNLSNWENNVLYIGNHLIKANTSLSADYIVKDGTLTIVDSAFSSCTSLTDITIPDSVTSIGAYAFSNCLNLTNVTIGKGVTDIGGDAFSGCSNIVELTLEIKEIPSDIFRNKMSLKKVTLLDGVERINGNAFSGCSLLETINIPDSVTYIGSNIMSNTAWYNYQNAGLIVLDDWIYGYKGDMPENYTLKFDKNTRGVVDGFFNASNNITAFDVASDNQFFSSVDGVLFNKDMTTILRYPMSRTDMQYTIPSTVTQIGTAAFYYCSNLIVVNIPENLHTIGNYAFYGCYNLVIAKMYDALTYIGDYAFYNCYQLADADIPDTVTYLGSYTFYNCDGLAYINIPSNMITINSHVFAECDGITELTIPDNVTSIGEYAFYSCSNLVDLKLGNGIEVIGNYAFCYCDKLLNITIPDNVKEIYSYAFGYSYKNSITFGAGITSAGYFANSKNVYFSGTQEDWNKIFGGSGYFSDSYIYLNHTHSYTAVVTKEATCTSDGSVTYTCVHGDSYTDVIPKLQHSWSEWDYNVLGQLYRECSVCGTAKEYGNASFENLIVKNVKATNISCSKVLLEWDEVEGASIYRIYIRYGNNSYNSWNYYTTASGNYEFDLSSGYDVVSFKVQAGYYDSYSGYSNYGEYTELANHSYAKHNYVSEYTPATITSSGIERIYCSICNITKREDYIPQINYIYLSSSTVTYNGKVRTPSVKVRNNYWEMLTNKVSYTYEYLDGEMKDPGVYRVKVTFKNRYAGEEILKFTILPGDISNFTTTGKYISADLNWDDVEGADIYRVYKTKNNRTTLIGTTTESNFKVIGLDPGTKYKVSVEAGTDIGNGEYIWSKRSTKYVTTTTFPLCDHVDENSDRLCDVCGDEALMYAGNYADTIFRLYVDGTLVISGTGIAYCRWTKYREFVKRVEVEEGITGLYSGCFARCNNLESVSLPSTLEFIGDEAFYSCEKLPAIDIPDSVNRLGNSVFSGCVSIESLTIPEGVTELRYYFASGCTALKEINLPSTIIELGDGAFAACTVLETIKLPEGLVSIRGAFKYCSALGNIEFPESLEKIEYMAFYDCDLLTDISFTDNLNYIGDRAFEECDGLIEITIPDNVEEISYRAFADCDNLVKVSTAADKIYENAFAECDSLVQIDFLEGTREIGWNAFYSMPKLSKVNFSNTVEIIDGSAFAECMAIEEIALPDSLVFLGDGAFYRCHNLKSVDFANAEEIGNGAFQDCIRLENVELGLNTTRIYSDAFKNCIRLSKITIHNPNCDIQSYRETIPENAVICGYSGSTAEKYADDWMRSFTTLSGEHTHRYNAKVTLEATCSAEGVKTFSCPCGDSYTESIAKSEHDYITFGGKAATCTEPGLAQGEKCKYCSDVLFAEAIVPALGHTMIADGANSINATCTTDGKTLVKCTACNYTESNIVSATGHSMSDGTCQSCGYSETINCSCKCHKGGLSSLLFKLILFFQKFLRMNKTCACGVAHY